VIVAVGTERIQGDDEWLAVVARFDNAFQSMF